MKLDDLMSMPPSAGGPIVRTTNRSDGCPTAAAAVGLLDVSVERIWAVLTDVERYAERVPLIDRVRVRGDLVDFGLRFKVSLLSVSFSFEAALQVVERRALSLAYRSGEPKDIAIDYRIEPLPHDPNASVLGVQIGFDPMSVGWLARFFLKHHPEIQYGIHPGCALALFDSMRKAA